jgi:hypothetical protein
MKNTNKIMALKEPKFHKGDFILTEVGFPSFVYENQISKGYISIYAFGIADEHRSEYPEKATKINKEEFFRMCSRFGYQKEYIIEKMKEFKMKA